MKKIFTLILVCCSLYSFSQSTTLVISQVYGAGGNSGAIYNADFVEIKNISASAISLSGYSIQYGSATTTSTWTGVYALPSVSVPAGGYYLIQMSAALTTGAALPTPDAVATPAINMAAAAGRVAIVNGTTALSGCPAASSYVDLCGFGTTAVCYEGSASAPAPSSSLADFRKNNGCTDTNNNSSDFETATPAPRNSGSTAISCTGPVATLSATTLTAFTNTCLNTTSAPNSFTITGTNLATSNITVGPLSGFTFSTTSAGTYTNSLSLVQTGGSYSQMIFVEFTPAIAQSYNGNIPVGGAGAATINVAAVGTGINTKATVTTGAASLVAENSATVAGTVTANGCSAITSYGAEYSTTSGFANGSGTAVPSTNISGGNYTVDLTGLAPSTTYYYHSYAVNNGGTAYGSEMSFTTLVSTSPYLSVTALTAFGNNCLNTTAGPNSFTVTGTALTNADITVGPLAGFSFATTSTGTYTSSLTLTQPGGSYSQMVYVQFTPTAVQSYDGNIVVVGGGASLVNVPASGAGVNTAAIVTTGAANSITQTSASLLGAILTTGCSAITDYGIEYSTTNGFANGTGITVTSSNLTSGNFSSVATGLAVNTTYYYHSFAVNAGGTAYGSQLSFKTSAAVLSATTLTAFGSVCINTTAGPGSFTISSNAVSSANINVAALSGYTYSTTSGGTYTSALSLTQPGGTYSQLIYVKFNPVAVQSYNGSIVISGGGATASVSVAASGSGINDGATVSTGAATNVSRNNVTLAGSITSTGCTAATSYGIEYSSISSFTSGSGLKVPSNNLSSGSYSINLNNLVQNSNYYYKAYATSSSGTSYGIEQTFTTAAISSEHFVIYSNQIVRGGVLNFSINNIIPHRYQAYIINSLGQVVYRKEIIVQVNFIDQKLAVPANLPSGVYILQISTTDGYLESKRFMLL
jgi:hypothetical protein